MGVDDAKQIAFYKIHFKGLPICFPVSGGIVSVTSMIVSQYQADWLFIVKELRDSQPSVSLSCLASLDFFNDI